jgi:hypothetical protein
MGFRITDGQGRNGDMAINKQQRADVSSQTNPRLFYASRDNSLSFKAIMPGFSAVAGNIVFYWKNTSANLNDFVSDLKVSSKEAALFKVFEVEGTAAAGDSLTDSNLNTNTGGSAQSEVMGGGATITGLTFNNQIGTARTTADGESIINFSDGLLIGPGKAIAVEYDTGTTGLCEVSMLHHFEDM